MKTILVPTVLASLFVSAESTAQRLDIIDTAIAAGSFKTLAGALTAADLVETLRGPGPFTVFAPTDRAFAKIDPKVLADLLKPQNKAKLTAILTHHVVAGRVPSNRVLKSTGFQTLNGQRVAITTTGGAKVGGSKITQTDILCRNGVIHVVDTVIMPASDDIVTTAVKAGSFKTLATALAAAGLVDTLKKGGPFTVFAPTDAAFAKLPPGTVADLLKPQNKAKLTAILTYHVVSGRVYSDSNRAQPRLTTLQGSVLKFQVRNGKSMIGTAKISAANVDASNGVIHVIDSVLLPPNM